VGIAAGTVRANIPSFGAEQVKLVTTLVYGETFTDAQYFEILN
jgi:hypothetical protein